MSHVMLESEMKKINEGAWMLVDEG